MAIATEAVLFFRDDAVFKEMYYSEFEAVLDDIVGIPDFKGDEVPAVFLQIDGQLQIKGAVFFLISFDKRGRVTGNWNVPLRHLLDHAGMGPDLGGGPIKVACRSACPVSWYRQQLWDPIMEDGKTFKALTSAIARNRLGVLVDEPTERSLYAVPRERFFEDAGGDARDYSLPVGQAPSAQGAPGGGFSADAAREMERAFSEKLASLRNAEKLNLATQAEDFQHRIIETEDNYNKKLEEREQQIAALKEELQHATEEAERLRLQLDKKSRWFLEKKKEFEQLISEGGRDYDQQIQSLKKEYEEELNQKLRDQAGDYEGRLSQRENELFLRATEIVEIRSELSRLRKQNQELLINGDEQLMQQMTEKGVVFVAYHPGTEHLVISREEMTSYLEDPTAFVAKRCDVDVERYKRWLEHYHLPICRATEEDGEICGTQIDKIMRPVLFRPGESDRCERHGGVPS